MRFLFTFAGGAGHFLPLARDLAGAGHAVAFEARATMLPTVEREGFQAFDAGGRTTRDEAIRGPCSGSI